MTNPFTHGSSWIALHWKSGALVAGFVGIAAACRWCLETDRARAQRAERTRKKELRTLADRISTYGRNVHRRYPTGDVVVSECDLAEQLGKRPESIVTALNILLGERKVQKAPLNGYWKLRSRPTPEDCQRETFA
jgi:cysteine sulfinate desulfinase/cysteine desulfurase-like protein